MDPREPLAPESSSYLKWWDSHPVHQVPWSVATTGAGSEGRMPFTHFANVVTVYLFALKLIKSKFQIHLLDDGCGTGRLTAFLRSQLPSQVKIAGIDASVPCISYARLHYSSKNLEFKHDNGIASSWAIFLKKFTHPASKSANEKKNSSNWFLQMSGDSRNTASSKTSFSRKFTQPAVSFLIRVKKLLLAGEYVDSVQRSAGSNNKAWTTIGSEKNDVKRLHTQYKQFGKFDFVLSSHVLEHIPQRESDAFLSRIKTLLKPGGSLVLGTPNRNWLQNLYHPNPTDDPRHRLVLPHEHEYAFTELKQILHKHFKKVEIYGLENSANAKFTLASIKAIGSPVFSNFVLRISYLRLLAPPPLLDFLGRLTTHRVLSKLKITYQNLLTDNRVKRLTTSESAKNSLNFIAIASQ